MMKAIPYVLLLALAVLFTQCKKEPEPDPEPEVSIPDNNFLNALIEQGIDTNEDGLISNAEAEAITSLSVSNRSISDMMGIEAFHNLEGLYCEENQLSSLDVSNNTALINLNCWNNQLTELNVSSNTVLEGLLCADNQLTNLDVSKNTALNWIHLIDMPSLIEVCVWTTPFPPEGVELDITGSPNVYFTTECSE